MDAGSRGASRLHSRSGTRRGGAPAVAALLGLLLTAVVVFAWEGGSQAPQARAGAPARQQAARAFARLPLRFEANRGQTGGAVRFLARGAGYTLFLTPREAVVSLANGKRAGAVVRTRLLGANPRPRIEGLDRLAGSTSYLKGADPARWHTDVPGFAEVRYADAYPGIDLLYHGRQGSLEYDFNVSPGADPRKIALGFRGARRLAIDRSGDLVISTAAGSVRQRRPVLYQRIGGERRPVTGRYVLQGPRRVGFRVGRYDRSRSLVIDPVLAYSTFLGATRSDVAAGVAVGPDGSAYVAGYTTSDNFPTTAGAYQAERTAADPTCSPGCETDAFVTRLTPDGSALVYATYLGGKGDDRAHGVAVDASGRAHVTGSAGPQSTDFPRMKAYQPAHAAATDAFLAMLSADGRSLVYSSFLGGDGNASISGDDFGYQVALDSAGRTYVTGETCSTNFPTKSAIQPARGGLCDAFVSKLDPDAASPPDTLVASTYLGGGAPDVGFGMAANGSGVHVGGRTSSTNFPVTANAHQSALAGAGDAFLTRLGPNLEAPSYSTYLGGTDNDFATGVALDSSGRVYVAGSTESTDLPTRSPFQPAFNGIFDAFVAKFDTQATDSLLYSSYLGGKDEELSGDIAVDRDGGAYVTGSTISKDFPTVNPVAPRGDEHDVFAVRVRPDGSGLSFGSYLGGGGPEIGAHPTGFAIAVDPASGSAYVTGGTDSTDFPTQNALRPDAPSHGNADREDAFVVKISPDAAGAPIVTGVSPRTGPGGRSVVVTGSGFTGATAVRFGAVDATSFTVQADDKITAVSPSQAVGPVAVSVSTRVGSSAPNPITRFHYTEGRWDATGSRPLGHARAPAVRLADGTVLVAGGCCDAATGGPSAASERYDPATGAWTLTGSLKRPRIGHTATLLADGKVLVAGGVDAAFQAVRAAELYDPGTGAWSTTGALATGRAANHTATLLASGKVLVAGGETLTATTFRAAELYDPGSGTWSSAGRLAAARAKHTATLLSGTSCAQSLPPRCGQVLVAGGAASVSFIDQPLRSAELYDPATNQWRPADPLAGARQRHTATVLADGRVLAIGGRERFESLASAELYTPATGRWSVTGIMRARRDSHAAVLLPSGKVLLAGGLSGLSHHDTAELYDPAAGRFRSEGVMTAYRGRIDDPPFAVSLGGGILVGGGGGGSSAEIYTPASASDSPPSASGGPPPTAPGGVPPQTAAPPAAAGSLSGCPPGRTVIAGTAGEDRLTGTPADDLILAEAGDDVVDGVAGDDCLALGAGDDRGKGGTGSDLIVGVRGADRAAGGAGKDDLRGGPGKDVLRGDAGTDRVAGGSGDDRLTGGSGSDRVFGEAGADVISGGAGEDRLSGGRGNDAISGGRGSDRITGGTGADRLRGNSGRDRISGGAGNDRIDVRDFVRDHVNCGKGRDTVLVDALDVVARNCEFVRRRARRVRAAASSSSGPRGRPAPYARRPTSG